MALEESTKRRMVWGAGFSFAFMAVNSIYNLIPALPIPFLGPMMSGLGSIFGAIALGLGSLVGSPILGIFLLFLLPKLLSSFVGMFTGQRSGLGVFKDFIKASLITLVIAGAVFCAAFFLLPLVWSAMAALAAPALMAISVTLSVIALIAAVYFMKVGEKNDKHNPFAEVWDSIKEGGALRTLEIMAGLGSSVLGIAALAGAAVLSVSPVAPLVLIVIGAIALSGLVSDTYGAFKGDGSPKPSPEDKLDIPGSAPESGRNFPKPSSTPTPPAESPKPSPSLTDAVQARAKDNQNQVAADAGAGNQLS